MGKLSCRSYHGQRSNSAWLFLCWLWIWRKRNSWCWLSCLSGGRLWCSSQRQQERPSCARSCHCCCNQGRRQSYHPLLSRKIQSPFCWWPKQVDYHQWWQYYLARCRKRWRRYWDLYGISKYLDTGKCTLECTGTNQVYLHGSQYWQSTSVDQGYRKCSARQSSVGSSFYQRTLYRSAPSIERQQQIYRSHRSGGNPLWGGNFRVEDFHQWGCAG